MSKARRARRREMQNISRTRRVDSRESLPRLAGSDCFLRLLSLARMLINSYNEDFEKTFWAKKKLSGTGMTRSCRVFGCVCRFATRFSPRSLMSWELTLLLAITRSITQFHSRLIKAGWIVAIWVEMSDTCSLIPRLFGFHWGRLAACVDSKLMFQSIRLLQLANVTKYSASIASVSYDNDPKPRSSEDFKFNKQKQPKSRLSSSLQRSRDTRNYFYRRCGERFMIQPLYDEH